MDFYFLHSAIIRTYACIILVYERIKMFEC